MIDSYWQWLIDSRSDCCTFAPKMFGKLPENTISRNYEITNKKLVLCAKDRSRAERVIMESIVAKNCGCKRVRHCGLISNARTSLEFLEREKKAQKKGGGEFENCGFRGRGRGRKELFSELTIVEEIVPLTPSSNFVLLKGRLPIKWTAPEVLFDTSGFPVTSKSDV